MDGITNDVPWWFTCTTMVLTSTLAGPTGSFHQYFTCIGLELVLSELKNPKRELNSVWWMHRCAAFCSSDNIQCFFVSSCRKSEHFSVKSSFFRVYSTHTLFSTSAVKKTPVFYQSSWNTFPGLDVLLTFCTVMSMQLFDSDVIVLNQGSAKSGPRAKSGQRVPSIRPVVARQF